MYRAHVVGSLLRPQTLIAAREQRDRGQLSAHEFKRLEDAAVDEAIRLQEACGIELITDGEQRRYLFTDSFGASVEGIELVANEDPTAQIWHDHEGRTVKSQRPTFLPVITRKLARGHSLATEEYSYARARAQRPLKVTLPSPTCALIYWSQRHSRAAYPGAAAALRDAAELLRAEIRHLAALGCEHVQIDAPELTMAIDPASAKVYEQAGFTRDGFLSEAMTLLNVVAGSSPVELSVHLCRGNNQGLWHSRGGYEAISKQCFPALKRFRYVLLEYDDERSGSFAALRDLPEDCVAVLGLVSTKRQALESLPALTARLQEAGRYIARERLAVSPQCGFASALFGNPLTPEEQAAKLRLVSALAHEIR